MIRNNTNFPQWTFSGKNQSNTLGPFSAIPAGVSGIFRFSIALWCDNLDTGLKTVTPTDSIVSKGASFNITWSTLSLNGLGVTYQTNAQASPRVHVHDGSVALTLTFTVVNVSNDTYGYFVKIEKIGELP